MSNNELITKYINLLKSSLVNDLYIENEAKLIHTFSCMLNGIDLEYNQFFNYTRDNELIKTLEKCKLGGDTLLLNHFQKDGTIRNAHELRNVTELSHTMVGKKRLENVQYCVETVLKEHIPGDFIETGIWRGGTCILMRGILMAYNETNRTIWAADSFEGVPPPSLEQDAGFDLSKRVLPVLAVTIEEVKDLFVLSKSTPT